MGLQFCHLEDYEDGSSEGKVTLSLTCQEEYVVGASSFAVLMMSFNVARYEKVLKKIPLCERQC